MSYKEKKRNEHRMRLGVSCSEKRNNDMNTLAIEQETRNYWELLKGASDQVKLSLISLLSSSLVSKEHVVKSSDVVQHVAIRPEDLEITPFVASIGQSIKPLPKDFDYDREKLDYLMKKYE